MTEGERALRRYENIESEAVEPARLGTRLYFRQQQFDTALTWGRRYRDRDPRDWEPYHFLAQIHAALQDYVQAEKMKDSAKLRSNNNPWVLLDEFLVEFNAGSFEEARTLASQLSNRARNPTIHWTLARTLGGRVPTEELVALLDTGGDSLPASPPPILEPVSEKRYRYWWARMNYTIDRNDRARTVLPDSPQSFRARWLQARLTVEPGERLRSQGDVLDRWGDKTLAQWDQSILARERGRLGTKHRRDSSNFFLHEYRNNRFLNRTEAALTSIIRALEMDPLREETQFELASYYGDRGWDMKRRAAARRADELGFNPPTQVQDYLEGLGAPDTYPGPPSPRARIGFRVERTSPWEGPLNGPEGVTDMLEHNYFHQPAFAARVPSAGEDEPLSRHVQGDTLDGGIRVVIEEWDEELAARIEYHLPSDRFVTRRFFDTGRMKIWRLLDRIVKDSKRFWPWTGTIFQVNRKGARVNLGRIHGFENGDTIPFKTGTPPREEPFVAEDVGQNTLRLKFPSPYYATEVEKGIEVGVETPETTEIEGE
jgi:tetratricopeptide (TPR) repeat protein